MFKIGQFQIVNSKISNQHWSNYRIQGHSKSSVTDMANVRDQLGIQVWFQYKSFRTKIHLSERVVKGDRYTL